MQGLESEYLLRLNVSTMSENYVGESRSGNGRVQFVGKYFRFLATVISLVDLVFLLELIVFLIFHSAHSAKSVINEKTYSLGIHEFSRSDKSTT